LAPVGEGHTPLRCQKRKQKNKEREGVKSSGGAVCRAMDKDLLAARPKIGVPGGKWNAEKSTKWTAQGLRRGNGGGGKKKTSF